MIRKSKQMCIGCRDNFYNGNNGRGIEECWCFKDAKVVRKKKVPMSMRPPWNMKPEPVLSCYHESGYVVVDPKTTC